MIIYNVTVNVENNIKEEWLHWMKTIHIPDVMKTGHFIENKICKVLVNEEQGTTFSVQYTAKNMDELKVYQKDHAPRLQKEHSDKYGARCVAFRTLLEVL